MTGLNTPTLLRRPESCSIKPSATIVLPLWGSRLVMYRLLDIDHHLSGSPQLMHRTSCPATDGQAGSLFFKRTGTNPGSFVRSCQFVRKALVDQHDLDPAVLLAPLRRVVRRHGTVFTSPCRDHPLRVARRRPAESGRPWSPVRPTAPSSTGTGSLTPARCPYGRRPG